MRKRPWLYRLIFVFTACTLFSWHTAGQANRHLYEQTLLQIELAAQTLPPAEVKALRFTAQDRDQPAFRALALRTKRCAEIMGSSSVYLLQKRGSSLYFGPESLPPGDPLSSVPGTIYRQPPQALLEVFSSHQSQVVGPYRDEYGNFVSAFGPAFRSHGRVTTGGGRCGYSGQHLDSTGRVAQPHPDAARDLLVTGQLAVRQIAERQKASPATRSRDRREGAPFCAR